MGAHKKNASNQSMGSIPGVKTCRMDALVIGPNSRARGACSTELA